jgi:hypothetical protein
MDLTEILLRVGPALCMVIFGIHQMAKPQDWLHYIPGSVQKFLLASPTTTMRGHALANIVLGLWLASGLFPLIGIWVALVWWASILPFAFRVSWAIGLRDLSITISIIALLVALTR